MVAPLARYSSIPASARLHERINSRPLAHHNSRAFRAATRQHDFILAPKMSIDPNRPNRLLIVLSDVHWTDATVGVQNLHAAVWEKFFLGVRETCERNNIKEVQVIIAGDGPDMIRSGVWAKRGFYPWQRSHPEWSDAVNEIIDVMIEKNRDVFDFIKNLPAFLKEDGAQVETVDTQLIMGNHDKELMLDKVALNKFYAAIGKTPDSFTNEYRRYIGKMYGNEEAFLDPDCCPIFPFYYADPSFRTFITHGQWRDGDNSRKVKAKGLSWSAKAGWDETLWRNLKLASFWGKTEIGFAPFLEPCFGDSVAAGVLSTFIYNAKERLREAGVAFEDLNATLDELDLFRPSYAAPQRILEITAEIRKNVKKARQDARDKYSGDLASIGQAQERAIKIIEDTLYESVVRWLGWDFTYETSPGPRVLGLRAAKLGLQAGHGIDQMLGKRSFGLSIKSIHKLMKLLAWLSKSNKPDVSVAQMKKFPSFTEGDQLADYDVHIEGHTHHAFRGALTAAPQRGWVYINTACVRHGMVLRDDGKGYDRIALSRVAVVHDFQAKEEERAKGILRVQSLDIVDGVGESPYQIARAELNAVV